MAGMDGKVLRRSRRDRVLAGVCGGLGEFFGISAFWFRLGFLLAALASAISRQPHVNTLAVSRSRNRSRNQATTSAARPRMMYSGRKFSRMGISGYTSSPWYTGTPLLITRDTRFVPNR